MLTKSVLGTIEAKSLPSLVLLGLFLCPVGLERASARGVEQLDPGRCGGERSLRCGHNSLFRRLFPFVQFTVLQPGTSQDLSNVSPLFPGRSNWSS